MGRASDSYGEEPHALNGGTLLAELPWAQITATWRGCLPKPHYSEQGQTKEAGARSAYVAAATFRRFVAEVGLDGFDVMRECKAKELALLRLRARLGVADEQERASVEAGVA